MKPNLREG